MVGSRDSIAAPNTVLNTIVADAFKEACDRLEKAEDFESAVHDLIKEYATEHSRIIFNGNGYSEEWAREAERRGLPVINSMVDAIPALTTQKAIRLFGAFGVFSKAELESRTEVQYETYAKAVNIEARTMLQMAQRDFLPAMMKYAGSLAGTVLTLKSCGADSEVEAEILNSLSSYIREAEEAGKLLEKVTLEAEGCPAGRKQACAFRDNVVPAMAKLRKPIDEAERIVERKSWPVPTYSDLIFEV